MAQLTRRGFIGSVIAVVAATQMPFRAILGKSTIPFPPIPLQQEIFGKPFELRTYLELVDGSSILGPPVKEVVSNWLTDGGFALDVVLEKLIAKTHFAVKSCTIANKDNVALFTMPLSDGPYYVHPEDTMDITLHVKAD